jgi:hypothetical protein
MNYSEFKKQAAGEGYRNPLLGASNSIKNKAPLLTSPTKQDKADFMSNWNKAPAQKKMDWFQGSKNVDPQFKTPFEQSPSEFVQAGLANKATSPFKNQTPTGIRQVQQQQPKSQPVQQQAQTNTQTTQQTKQQPTNNSEKPGSVIPSDLLNNDAINRIKDPKEMRKYLEIMMPVSAGLQQLVSGGKFSMDAVLENDTAVDGFSKALETANPMALQVLQQMQKEVTGSNKGGGSKPAAADGATTPSVRDQNMKKLTNAAAKGVWNSVKENPIENFPKAIGMFLSHMGAGQGVTDFVSNPFAFYGSLMTLLVGGGLLLGGGGSDQQQQSVVNNYYYGNQQQPMGFGTLPARA